MARKQYGLKPGDVLSFDMEWDGGGMHLREPVIGFMPDLKYNSFRSITEPFAFYVGPNTPVYGASKAMIRTGAHTNLAALKADLTEALHDVDPNYLPEIRLFDERRQYRVNLCKACRTRHYRIKRRVYRLPFAHIVEFCEIRLHHILFDCRHHRAHRLVYILNARFLSLSFAVTYRDDKRLFRAKDKLVKSTGNTTKCRFDKRLLSRKD